VILFILFAVQQFGTGRIGGVLGPVMLAWFLVIAVLGVKGIASEPHVLLAINPWYAVSLAVREPFMTFLLLGFVVLVITGGEALYADIGHFGIGPVRLAWYSFVAPALALNYFGQGALVLAHCHAADDSFISTIANPFYALVPGALQLPMVVLATVATVIASQAMISEYSPWRIRRFDSATCRACRSFTPRTNRFTRSTSRA
jgi:KUP system potassium uptake protein